MMQSETKKDSEVGYWCDQIDAYNKQFGPWVAKAKKINKRYKDDRPSTKANVPTYNILWSNIQTLKPALFDRPPIVNIDRRYQTSSDDRLSTVSALVLERCTSYFVQTDLFSNVVKQAVEDRLLAGRGLAWVRYVPNFKDADVQGSIEVQGEGVQSSEDVVTGDDAPPEQELYSEDTVFDYVYYEDFGHTYARVWEELRAGWRAVPMARKELVERFGEEVGYAVPMDSSRRDDKSPEHLRRATVYEIWDKHKKEAIWINKNYPNVLDRRPDPLKLKNFFPFPKPLYATVTTDCLVPTPDYILYQDQAQELDVLTQRISLLTSALRVAGVYDASAEAIGRLLLEGAENKLIPVERWAVMGEKGGLQGAISFLPIKEIADVLQQVYASREAIKQDIYEITGISDIVRGATDPNETLGAQELKGKYAGLRIGEQQKDVSRFCADLTRICAEIISEHFSIETIKQLSGYKLLTAQEKQMIEQQALIAQQSQGQIAPPDEEELKLLEEPTWEEVEALIRNEVARCFRIEIETDSTIKQDQDADKAARTEFVTAATGFIQQAAQVQDSDVQLLLMELLRFGMKGFKISREIETSFEMAMKKIREKSANPQPQPNPEAEKAQTAIQLEQMRIDGEMQKMQLQAQNDQAKAQSDIVKMQLDREIKAADLQLKEMDLVGKRLDIAAKEKEIASKQEVSDEEPTQDTD